MDARLASVLKLETELLGARSSALVGAPITVNSALNRQSVAAKSPATASRPATAFTEDHEDDDGAPDWPPAEVEAAMSAEAAIRDTGAAPRSRSKKADVETLDGGPLPALDEMLQAIPASLQAKLDELFRAKFTGVRRVPAAVLKVNQVEAKSSGTGGGGDDPALDVEESEDD